MPKPLTVWVITNYGKFFRRWISRPPDLPSEKSASILLLLGAPRYLHILKINFPSFKQIVWNSLLKRKQSLTKINHIACINTVHILVIFNGSTGMPSYVSDGLFCNDSSHFQIFMLISRPTRKRL